MNWGNGEGASAVMTVRVDLVYRLARRLVARRHARHGGIAVAADWGAYARWREQELREPGAGENYLNKLTVREFEAACRDAGFRFARREFRPFGLPQPAKVVSRMMTRLPSVRDFFTACALYELVRPNEA